MASIGSFKTVRKAKKLSCDTETTGLRVWHGDQPFAIGFCTPDGDTWAVEWEVDPYTRVVVPDEEELEQVAELCEDPAIEMVFHNAKFDVRMLDEAYGIKVAGKLNETMFKAHMANSLEPSYGLKRLCKIYLDYSDDDEADLQKAVVAARRYGKKEGWLLAFEYVLDAYGNLIKTKAATKADYWMPKAVDPDNDLCLRYLIGDVERTMLLSDFYDLALTEYDLWEQYEWEMELWPITYEMEKRGVRVDRDECNRQMQYFVGEMEKALAEVQSKAWKGFNIESNKDLSKLLYKKLKLPVKRRTEKTMAPATNVDALYEHLSSPTVEAIFRYRASSKAISTFFQKYLDSAVEDPLNPGHWALHPDFQQVGPNTGRYSCRNPNMQNVANALTTRSPMPIQARTPFGPRDGYVWYHIDYHQLEVVIFADVAQEPTMLKAIEEGRDLHTECTNKAWGGSDNEAAVRAADHALEFDGTGDGKNEHVNALWKQWGITDAHRLMPSDRENLAYEWLRQFNFDIVKAEKSIAKKTSRAKAKMILFAKVFGGGPNAIKDLLQCSYSEAAGFLNDYDAAFPEIVRYIRELSNQARADGYIIDRWGYKLTVDPDYAYQAVNRMVQGSAAKLMKRAMVKCDRYLKSTGLDAHIIMTIHDEIAFEWSKKHSYPEPLRQVCRIMEDHEGRLGVPVHVEVERVTSKWNEKSKVKLKW